MIDPRIVLVIAAIYGVIWVVGEEVKGLRWVKHHTQTAIHHVLHPKEKDVKR